MGFALLPRRRERGVPCTVEIVNTFDMLGAHLRFDDGSVVYPGDEVVVDGESVVVPYGQSVTLRRTATITRANAIERAWTKATGDLEFMELCEFSFSEEVSS